MIYSLRRKLIWICSVSVIAVFICIFIFICILSRKQLNSVMDTIADKMAENAETFPEFEDGHILPPEIEGFPDFFTEETPFSIRFFTVCFDSAGEIVSSDIEFVSSISEETAQEYGRNALSKGEKRGWIKGFRYKLYDTDSGQNIIFVDGNMNRSVSNITLLSVGLVLVGSLGVIVVLIIIFSKRAVKPIVESYEKQKQFITDANHELKTPLTLILTNLDIVQSELGENEWLEDIRAEGERMDVLIRQLVSLTKMDEEENKMTMELFFISDMVTDTVSEFNILAEKKGIQLHSCIQGNVKYTGNEIAVRRLVSILLDNAIKYCDPNGEILLKFYRKRKCILIVENTCANVGELELHRLFDRFYRADKSRSFDGGFGIGLSIAKAIVHRHHGDICAYKKEDNRIGFKVTLK